MRAREQPAEGGTPEAGGGDAWGARGIPTDVLDSLDVLLMGLDADGRIVFFNAACRVLSGYGSEEVRGSRPWEVLVAPEDAADCAAQFEALRTHATATRCAAAWVDKNGERHLVAWSHRQVLDEHGAFCCVVSTGFELDSIRQLQGALGDNEARLRSIIDTCPDAVVTIDEAGIVQSFSPAAERMFGYPAQEVVGRNVSMLMPPPYREQHDSYLARYLAAGERRIIGIGREVTARHKDGTTFPMELAVGEVLLGGRRLFTVFIRDISVRKRAEANMHQLQAQLVHVARVSAMGEMASTLAHELNQPLTAIVNYAQAARRMLAADPAAGAEQVDGLLHKVAQQADRAGTIIRRLRGFVRHGEQTRLPAEVNGLIEEACQLALIGTGVQNIRMRYELAADLPAVHVDRIGIQQVVVNLVRNAVDALEACEQRDLVVRTLARDGAVEVQIQDSGPGIAAEIREHLFEPFQTTKPDGLGIGLPISRSLVDANGGRLWSSEPAEGGTVFHFTLPTRGP